MSLRRILTKIASQYATARNERYSSHPLADYIRNSSKQELKKSLHSRGIYYDVDSGVGITKWATCPWIAVLDGKITSSAKKGVYVVYLFNGQDKKVVLSLNQGVSAFQEDKVSDYKKILKMRASFMRESLSEFITGKTTQIINLGWRGDLPKLYEVSHAFGFEYRASDMPSDNELWADLEHMLRAYSSFVEQGGFDSPEDPEEAVSHSNENEPGAVIEKLRRKIHKAIERKSNVSARVKSKRGCRCDACKKEMREIYGDLGKGYIEVHHKKPLSTLDEGVPVNLDVEKDFAVLCANCHRMIHRLPDPSDVARLTQILEQACQPA